MKTSRKLLLVKDMMIGLVFCQIIHISKKIIEWNTLDSSKQLACDADLEATQQINFTANLYQAGDTYMFFICEQLKETILDFSQSTVKV